ncbi:MAG TPA: hypothetical protein PKC58_17300 [Ignavibacteria bacterium]|nr:hypothetical protein [Ignavibacteria bacterium]
MKKCRTSAEIKNSIFKGLDEAIELTEKIPQNKISEKETPSEIKITEINNGKKLSHKEESKLRSFAKQKVPAK